MSKHLKDMWELFVHILFESYMAIFVLAFCIAVLFWVIK